MSASLADSQRRLLHYPVTVVSQPGRLNAPPVSAAPSGGPVGTERGNAEHSRKYGIHHHRPLPTARSRCYPAKIFMFLHKTERFMWPS